MLIYNLINNSTKKKWKKITSNVCTYKKKSYLWEQGVVGSNPATPTKEKDFDNQ